MTSQQLAAFRAFVESFRAMQETNSAEAKADPDNLQAFFDAAEAWHEAFRVALREFGCEAQTYAMDNDSIALRGRFLQTMKRLA